MRMLLVFLVFATVLTAQRGGRMGGGGGFRGGFGGGVRGGFSGHGYRGGGFTHRPGGFNRGYNRGFISRPRHNFGRYTSFGRSRYGFSYYPYFSSYISPFWSYPSYYSPYYYGYGYSNMAAGPNITVMTAPAADTTPSTIIVNNPTPRSEEARSEPKKDEAPQQPEPTAGRSQIYLIAARDGIVWAALAYWTEGANLHFVTIKGEKKQMPLAQIDRDLSEQFNRERGVPFRLP
jgi:hypothetical protein